jgi:hypothetical protein
MLNFAIDKSENDPNAIKRGVGMRCAARGVSGVREAGEHNFNYTRAAGRMDNAINPGV